MDDLLIAAMQKQDNNSVYTMMHGLFSDISNVIAAAADYGYWDVASQLIREDATWLEIHAMETTNSGISSKRLLYYAILNENIEMLKANLVIETDDAVVSLAVNRDNGSIFEILVTSGHIIPHISIMNYAIKKNLNNIIEKLIDYGIMPLSLSGVIETCNGKAIRSLVSSGLKPTIADTETVQSLGMYDLADFLIENL
jgi:hypothetical protein